jgi:hypothetical protein
MRSFDDNNIPIAFFTTIPAWKQPYEVYNILNNSGYCTYITNIPRTHAKFINYYDNKYIYPCAIYFILVQNKASKNIHNININELKYKINSIFKINNISGGSPVKISTKNTNIINIITLNHIKNYRLKSHITTSDQLNDYETLHMRKYYLKLSKSKKIKPRLHKSRDLIIYNINTIMNTVLNNIKLCKNILMIDKTPIVNNDDNYIMRRLEYNYNTLATYFIKNSNAIYISFDVDYLSNNINHKINNVKYDFIFVSGNLEYYMIKKLIYFSEQISAVIHHNQIYLLLKHQRIAGSAIILMYTFDTNIYRSYIYLLLSYYKKVHLFKSNYIKSNISYIVCEHFLGITNEQLNKINDVNTELSLMFPKYNEDFNVLNESHRKKYNVKKEINANSYETYLTSIYKHIDDPQINQQINNFSNNI